MSKKKKNEDVCLGFKIDGVLYSTEEIPEIVVEKTFNALGKMLEHKKIFIETTQAG